jgi:hypothetical protein
VTRGYKVSLLTALYFAQGLPIVSAIPCVLPVRAVIRGHGPARLQCIWRRAAA